ncbi:hypothetical protein SEA_CRAZYRICH_12 [Microbacterium phage CrazyRich]|uniref:Uncharacterized protein n=1 Tax=Microbacterium phage NoodlelyBoi TaxID=2813165 RepID=A0A899IRT2_9CAUD|nr:hypothetical protein QDA08_gp12 [Microbacterium phage NoodlelyBoi]QSM01207.1 hypothetical protein SEA_NOODLELYBOI_12 [Microbacterium phage NoodlelyBoi]UVK58586.1 hypothetical protein SEA_CRAZYRICH_12 [Microbacterium phage CrazyRich]
MILTHYSAEPLTLDLDRQYDQTGLGSGKPVGLWLSDESDHGWKAWCESEEWGLSRLVHATEFEVVSDRVLHLSTPEAIREFTRRYGSPLFAGGSSHWIDWGRVASEHDGLLITPYQWSCRLGIDTMWYYGWDVASACIWRLDAIRRVEVVR